MVDSFKGQFIFRFQGQDRLIQDVGILVDRFEILLGFEMGIRFFQNLGQRLIGTALLLVRQPDPANAFVSLFKIDAVLFNGGVLP